MSGWPAPAAATWSVAVGPAGLLAVGLAAVAAALAFRPRVVLDAPREAPGPVASRLVVAAVGLLAAAAWSWLGPRQLVLVGLGLAVAGATVRSVRRGRRRADADRRRGEVLEVCEAMAADLAAGQPPVRALERAADEWPELAPVAVAARVDADVPGALRAVGLLAGAGELRGVAAAWQVAHETGSGLAPAIAQAASAARGRRRTSRLVAAELAGARATARTLAALPALVALMAIGIGTDPVGFLTGTTGGLVCLTLGLGLSWLGLAWLERIGDRVLR
ncbi:type II secretion system F family protein [Nocardioides aurantiacus]|uniref:Tight adherence protein B n=1 Tax=Nocardioides aurantiacus TaxID=86796 RepID=A0A3N2CP93_9ACTN|nr:type II secretion system F family protein [Nocardioides aurantiacus]ROR89340.1 tight adherence protein B [Nocardioides aurantiacus]